MQLRAQIEAARAHEGSQRLERGRDRISLPARDLGAILARPIAKIALGEPGAEPSFAEDAAAGRHEIRVKG